MQEKDFLSQFLCHDRFEVELKKRRKEQYKN